MINDSSFLIKPSIDRLEEALKNRIAVWPQPMSLNEEDEVKTIHALGLIEQYVQRVGTQKLVTIINASDTDEGILDGILQQAQLSEMEDELILRDQAIGVFPI